MSGVREALEGYLAGRLKAERLVEVVTAAYYAARGAGSGERLRSLIEVIDRAHPGVVELAATTDRPGFAVRPAERSFPKQHEAALRAAVQAALGAPELPAPRSPLPTPGFWSRLSAAVRRLFTAST